MEGITVLRGTPRIQLDTTDVHPVFHSCHVEREVVADHPWFQIGSGLNKANYDCLATGEGGHM